MYRKKCNVAELLGVIDSAIKATEQSDIEKRRKVRKKEVFFIEKLII
jgi:hypothetical protein